MPSSDEYVEKHVLDGYKRELDQEENVFRSMPIFATALGVLATAIGLARPAIGPFGWTFFPIAIHVVLALLAVPILLALLFLYRAIRLREFQISDERELAHGLSRFIEDVLRGIEIGPVRR